MPISRARDEPRLWYILYTAQALGPDQPTKHIWTETAKNPNVQVYIVSYHESIKWMNSSETLEMYVEIKSRVSHSEVVAPCLIKSWMLNWIKAMKCYVQILFVVDVAHNHNHIYLYAGHFRTSFQHIVKYGEKLVFGHVLRYNTYRIDISSFRAHTQLVGTESV